MANETRRKWIEDALKADEKIHPADCPLQKNLRELLSLLPDEPKKGLSPEEMHKKSKLLDEAITKSMQRGIPTPLEPPKSS